MSVNQKFLRHIEHKGGENFKSLNRRDLDFLFELYDKTIFDRQISRQLGQCKYPHINFKLNTRMNNPVVFIIANEELMIDISVNGLNKMVLEKIFKTRLDALQTVMEWCLVHLMIILWGYRKLNKKHNGKLFECVYKTYFTEKNIEQKNFVEVIVHKNFSLDRCEHPISPIKSYANWENSCYLDSVLTILLYVPKIRNLIFSSSPPTTQGKIFKEAIIQDYDDFTQNPNADEYCTTIRKLLAELIPDLKENKEWVPYDASSTYSHIADLIPELKPMIPFVVHRHGVKGNVKFDSLPFLQMWDFMEPFSKEKISKEILFDEINTPILVFSNGGIPRIKEFNKKGKESGVDYIDGNEYEFEVEKIRKFDETILGKYELVGVVTLHGVTEEGEGVHYTCHFKNKEWYYYNDVGPTIRKIQTLPDEGVWIEKDGRMPSMYFYVLK
jgi:hypothetical protein